MDESEQTQICIEVVAKESLDIFAKVTNLASSHLADPASDGPTSLAYINMMASPGDVGTLRKIKHRDIAAYRWLCKEPAIARVVIESEDGTRETYYICRATPVVLGDDIKLASYRSPVGRVASLPVGSDFDLRREHTTISVTVVEQAKLHPFIDVGEWDSRNSVLEGDDYGPLTVDSFLKVLRQRTAYEEENLLEGLLAEEEQDAIIREGIRRGVITRMGLRDQPTLDQFQDEIFRLPLNTRLLILGAPGTGKTTTLIHRLGQKLDLAQLDEDDKQTIRALRYRYREGVEFDRDWIMFTPTELLKLYVKEAFNRENVPAPDERITTWKDFRDDLARHEFRILRSASRRGSYVMKQSDGILRAETESDSIKWFIDFDEWQNSLYWHEMRKAAENLSKVPDSNLGQLGRELVGGLDCTRIAAKEKPWVLLVKKAGELAELVENRKESTDKTIFEGVKLQLSRNGQFLDDFLRFIEQLPESNEDTEDQDAEEIEPSRPRFGRVTKATREYVRAVRAQARARARGRRLPRSSRAKRVVEWLGDRSLPEQELLNVGKNLIVQSLLRQFVNFAQRYINRVPVRYRQFRRIRQKEKRWYLAGEIKPTEIHPLEVDILLLTMIRSTEELISGTREVKGAENLPQPILARLRHQFRSQVLVDEATDFSPVQLSCMRSISLPETRSFFACGDFNQRLTSWGTRSVEQMRWAVPGIKTRSVSVAYRQSAQLHEFARQIVNLTDGDAAEVNLPGSVEEIGFPPALAVGLSGNSAVATWIASRIREIERFVEILPSIAVLVNNEEEVDTIATALGVSLADVNIRVIPCRDGHVLGSDSAVRVLNVEHIKGLEFEAVFFVGVDKLVADRPDLFDKYLYVGATRAATYFGMTCEEALPSRLSGLQQFFGQKWE